MLSLISLEHLEFIDEKLREMFLAIQDHYGTPFVITSLYRIDDAGVHGTLPLRGIDARCRDREVAEPIAAFVNSRWQYDFNRPEMRACVAHNAGTGYHLHFQVHPNTREILVSSSNYDASGV